MGRCYPETRTYYKKERVEVLFKINRDGSVSHLKMIKDKISNDVEKCILEIIGKLEFPKPKKVEFVNVKQPYILRYRAKD